MNGEEGVNHHQRGEAEDETSPLTGTEINTSITSKKTEDLEILKEDPHADPLPESLNIGSDPTERREENRATKTTEPLGPEKRDAENI